MPVAVATGRALQRIRLDAKLDPPLSDRHVVMAGVRLTDPLEQSLLDESFIEQLSVDDLRSQTPAVFAQMDRLSRLVDKIYVHIDMDVLDPREVMGRGNKVPNGPSSDVVNLTSLLASRARRSPPRRPARPNSAGPFKILAQMLDRLFASVSRRHCATILCMDVTS